LGTGVLAAQVRRPPLLAMAAATLQALNPDREVLLGVGVSSPTVAGDWHGAASPSRPVAYMREFIALLRLCLSGQPVTFSGDHFQVRRFRLGVEMGERTPKIILGALGESMLRLGGEVADGVLVNYLPATHVPACVAHIRHGGDVWGRSRTSSGAEPSVGLIGQHGLDEDDGELAASGGSLSPPRRPTAPRRNGDAVR
jgi:5,10-methylenetetrahydromethanopterin reductase